ncbi:MAG: MGMT family protein [Gammaproteobacteria bacterium]|nr:MAG: MGMT family protein [Gammaproteobacteria bacterium]
MTNFQIKFDRLVWKVVVDIPPGQVMSYGEVANIAGFPRYSRMVSGALGRSPQPLPWFRVVRSNRTLAFEPGSKSYREQARLLKQEGVRFEGLKVIVVNPTITLDEMLWGPQD